MAVRAHLWLLVLALLVGIAAGATVALVSPLLLVAVIAGLIGGILILSSTQIGLLAVIGVATLLPFAVIPVRIGFYPTFLDVALVGFFAVWLARLCTRPEEGFLTSPLDVPLLVFVLLAGAAFVQSVSLGSEGVRRFAEIILSLFLYIGVINTVRRREQVEQLLAALILGGGAAAAIGLFLYFIPHDLAIYLLSTLRYLHYPAGAGVLRFLNDDPTLPMRATSTAIDPNVFGGLLILVITLAVSQLFSPRPVLRRLLLWPALAAMLMVMPLTYSRASWGGLAVALLFIATLKYPRLWLVFLLAGLAAALFVPQADTFVGHLLSGAQFQDRAAAMRLGEYKDALQLIARYPLFGIGFGASPDINLYRGVSSIYLLIAEEMGLIGLGAFLVVVVIFFVQTLPAIFRKDNTGLVALTTGFVAALVGALAAGLFDHYFFNLDFPHAVALFWLCAGLAMVTVRLGREAGVDG